MIRIEVTSNSTNIHEEAYTEKHCVEKSHVVIDGVSTASDHAWDEYYSVFREVMDQIGYCWLPSASRIRDAIQNLIDEDIEMDRRAEQLEEERKMMEEKEEKYEEADYDMDDLDPPGVS